MRFGAFWPYSQTLIPSAEIARRNPDILDLDNHVALATRIEAMGMDFVLIADGYAPGSPESSSIGFQDPSTNAVVLSVPLLLATRHLGVIATIHTTFVHPVVIARLAAHLDWISGGRWGWNIVNGFREHEARLFGMEQKPGDGDGGYGLAAESLSVIKGLWANSPEGISHGGDSFSVQGRIRRPVPEATPLLVSAASSAKGRAFAAANCDYLFTSAHSAEAVKQLTDDLETDAAAANRSEAPDVLMLSDILVREEPGRAQEEYAELIASTDPDAQRSWTTQLAKIGTRRLNPGHPMTFLGTASEVAEQIVELHRGSGLKGLIVRMLLWSPKESQQLEPVFGHLKKAGVWMPPAERDFSW